MRGSGVSRFQFRVPSSKFRRFQKRGARASPAKRRAQAEYNRCMTRRHWLQTLIGACFVGVPANLVGLQSENDIEIWKTPTCGCCKLWVDHIRSNGFKPTVHDMPDVSAIKRKLGVPTTLESCHTAVVGGYAIEGHVPADVVRTMLKEKPKILGLAVPGMPMGSPGMEGSRKDPYNVIAFQRNGQTTVFAKR